ncbi:MAG TPA: hypothetical protein VFH45_13415 [Acidimicrobiales bacterium]|nr:hypothetical protein [Acidimicrobiales bacterium]
MEVAELKARARPAVLAGERTLPVLPGLEPLLPGGLRRGTVVAVGSEAAVSGASFALALALAAGPSGAGSWVAALGLEDLGAGAAEAVGVDLARLALVPDPGPRRAEVAALLIDAVDLVLLRPGSPMRAQEGRRLAARARQRGAVLVVVGRPWPEGCDLALTATVERWEGLGEGHGYLTRRLVEVSAGGRRSAGRPRRARLWLPGGDGGVQPAPPVPVPDKSQTARPSGGALRGPAGPGVPAGTAMRRQPKSHGQGRGGEAAGDRAG